ncbi:MAG: 50S ribosomal protein L9 [Chloroflexi bacterium]|nr:50S ribosomal protein L9 [Chloroflexota bacterium]
MKIILTQDVLNLGRIGEVKRVADGYARNYLIPQGLAVQATQGAMKEFERRREVEARKDERFAEHAEALAQKLDGLTLTFEAKAGSKGRLYGSITPSEIADELSSKLGETLDRRKHVHCEPIREVGEHKVQIRLTADIVPEITVIVKPEGGELPEPEQESASSDPVLAE